MGKTSSTGSFQQSFLDLLFGALGAVVLLFILISITSGPPPRPLDPVSRHISWSIVSEELPTTNFALYFAGRDKEGTPVYSRLDLSAVGEETFTKEKLTRNSSLGLVTSERMEVNGKAVQKVTVEVPSDDRWISNLALEVQFEQKPTKGMTVTVEATPGNILIDGINPKEFSSGELGNCLRIETIVELKEENGGLLPFMDPSNFNAKFTESIQ